MKYETLIWSGCSHSFGSGIMDEDFNSFINEYGSLENAPVKFCHPKCYDDFPNVVTVADAKEAIKQRAYPHQIGKKLGFKNTYNLSVQGAGIETQLRNVSSFIIENEDKIDFSKSVFCYQLPAFNRVEIVLNNEDASFNADGWGWSTFNFRGLEDNSEWGMDFFLRHFDFDYYTAKFLMYLYEYKGFLESKGILFLPFEHFPENIINNINKLYPYQRNEEIIQNKMNNRTSWTHHKQIFPDRKTLLKKIDMWDTNFQKPILPKTLRDVGYCNDNHFSPEGHDAVAHNLSIQLKEKLSI
jgi:hypothetical protein